MAPGIFSPLACIPPLYKSQSLTPLLHIHIPTKQTPSHLQHRHIYTTLTQTAVVHIQLHNKKYMGTYAYTTILIQSTIAQLIQPYIHGGQHLFKYPSVYGR